MMTLAIIVILTTVVAGIAGLIIGAVIGTIENKAIESKQVQAPELTYNAMLNRWQ